MNNKIISLNHVDSLAADTSRNTAAVASATSEAIRELVNAINNDINSRTAHGVFSIAVNDWQTINDPDYGYCANISVSGLTADDYAEINFTRSSLSVVAEAELCPSGETVADAIHIYAKNIPSTSITGEIFIHRGRELI